MLRKVYFHLDYLPMSMVKIKVKGLFASGPPGWILPIRLSLLPMDKIKVFLKAFLLAHSFTINWSLAYTQNLRLAYQLEEPAERLVIGRNQLRERSSKIPARSQ